MMNSLDQKDSGTTTFLFMFPVVTSRALK